MSKATRNEIRTRIFDGKNRKPATRIIQFFGEEIEIHQPLLSDIMSMTDEGSNNNIANMLIKYSYVKGTDEKVFEEADLDTLTTMPFTADFARFTTAVQELTDIDLKAAEGN